jgi:hypothetical protein
VSTASFLLEAPGCGNASERERQKSADWFFGASGTDWANAEEGRTLVEKYMTETAEAMKRLVRRSRRGLN